jgi:cytochrome c553
MPMHGSLSKRRRGRIIKAGSQSVLLSAALANLFFSVCRAEDAQSGALSQQHVHSKMQYCEVCHGVNGQGFPGYYPIPRLAGQQPEYLENQLNGFSERKREFNIMNQVSHSLSPAMITALATAFSKLNPKPVGGAPQDRVAEGKQIYEQGIPNANVPACASCHGADGKGNFVEPIALAVRRTCG